MQSLANQLQQQAAALSGGLGVGGGGRGEFAGGPMRTDSNGEPRGRMFEPSLLPQRRQSSQPHTAVLYHQRDSEGAAGVAALSTVTGGKLQPSAKTRGYGDLPIMSALRGLLIRQRSSGPAGGRTSRLSIGSEGTPLPPSSKRHRLSYLARSWREDSGATFSEVQIQFLKLPFFIFLKTFCQDLGAELLLFQYNWSLVQV